MAKTITKEWLSEYQERLSEKYKFLMISQLKNYDIFDFIIDEIILSKDTISIGEMTITTVLDYNKPCSGDAYDIGRILREMEEDLNRFFYNHLVDPVSFKFSKTTKAVVHGPLILEFDYKLDESHKVTAAIRIDYDI